MIKNVLAFAIAICIGAVAAAEEVVCNDEWSIRPGTMQTQAFTLKRATPVEFDVTPVKHADKGVSIHIVPAALWDAYKAGHATLKAIRDESTERARTMHKTVSLKAGAWVFAVENSENLLERAIVRAKVTVDPAVATSRAEGSNDVPTKIGQCVDTSVKTVGYRLGSPGTGTAIQYANGVAGVGYATVPQAEESKPGDSIHLCLVSVPQDCPPGDDRGKVYKATNKRTGKTWQMQNSSHSCGGA